MNFSWRRRASILLRVPRDEGYYYVYFVCNESRVVLYIGVTNNLEGRLYQHRGAEIAGFTERYRVNRLVYYEDYPDARSAIAREKQLKGWTRAKKNALVERFNPHWNDLTVSVSHQQPGAIAKSGSQTPDELGAGPRL